MLEIAELLPMQSSSFFPSHALLLHPLKVTEMVLEHFLLEGSLPHTYFLKVQILSFRIKEMSIFCLIFLVLLPGLDYSLE